uniref:Zmp:0000000912 n=1 Tax=Astyanax mexicanus TaxID=7994 RepID=A0A3B1JFG1_ASTMX
MTDSVSSRQQHSEEKSRALLSQKDYLFERLQLKEFEKQKLKPADVLQITAQSVVCKQSCSEEELVQTFLQKLLLVDYRARCIPIKEAASEVDRVQSSAVNMREDEAFSHFINKKKETTKNDLVHPMDVQMAVFHCSDSFLKQLIVTKLSQCQYALPLLVPDPFTGKIEFPLWAFRQIKKSWKSTDMSGMISNNSMPVYNAENPMVAFFRIGLISRSKSKLINDLINEKHNTFFHRDCQGSSTHRLLMDGVVEIAWYCPSGKSTDHFTDCVAFCNLHGDAETLEKQLEILTEMSSVNVVVLGDNITNNAILQKLFKGPKPLVCLLCEDDSCVSGSGNLKFKLGLKGRNQATVSEELRNTIKECLTNQPSPFRLEDVRLKSTITTDENNPECKQGKEAALQMIRLLEGMDLCEIKRTYLPCQGKLWREWCKKNKEQYRLHGTSLEKESSEKHKEMDQIREQQYKQGLTNLTELFIRTMNSGSSVQNDYFHKWVEILLDKLTADGLSALHNEYDEKWSKVLSLKRKHVKSEQMKDEQTELEMISEKLQASTFGLEHILREMAQLYESFISVQTDNKGCKEEVFSSLPKLAAELLTTGHPLELMDGDAAHVPLVWVSAVLDELSNKLGDQRVFVLSVLGIQSSGKSTMLNAMFGLQFAVSAGRCTRGAFMQLVKVSEEMKGELTFDYILVVDTEGLQALELTGICTRHHDNELATFVVGLGNLTLINIFGENPSEMQDILQIVVQAFMRMKKVRLKPSCVFVHQNVTDVAAGEKMMEGRRRLQEKLDEMTKLAAKEEVCNADCFNDIIAFDVEKDVKYFAQLWEGSPPMAPPNPCYSENILDLKKNLLHLGSNFHTMTKLTTKNIKEVVEILE